MLDWLGRRTGSGSGAAEADRLATVFGEPEIESKMRPFLSHLSRSRWFIHRLDSQSCPNLICTWELRPSILGKAKTQTRLSSGAVLKPDRLCVTIEIAPRRPNTATD
jgi:hypothetical protein